MEDENIDLESEKTEENPATESESKNGISADLIRGHINTIILRTLYERDKYGYEIIEEIETKSHGQYSLKQPTLYSALKRLESQGYINAYWRTDEVSQGGRRKYYTLTDSGREITERNQAEWEYSRTVIDNLISDRNFDFSQPAPSAVDFKILKNSTSRVRSVKDDDDDEREVQYDEPTEDQIVEVKHEDATDMVIKESDVDKSEPQTSPTDNEQQPVASSPLDLQQQYIIEQQAEQIKQLQQTIQMQQVQMQAQQMQELQQNEEKAALQKQAELKALHDNYLKLISEPAPAPETPQTPYAENIDTDKLIYNNRPETERDYRNLINNLFIKTIKNENTEHAYPARETAEQPSQIEPTSPEQSFYTQMPESIKIDDAVIKAREDGLTIGASEYSIGTRKKRYNRGSALFKSSVIVGIIMLLEFALCLIFKDELGVTLAYPFVIFALDCAQILIFGVLYYTDMGKSSRKPTTFTYLSACIIVTIAAVPIIFIVSLLLNVNFAIAGDIMAKIVIPCFIALNITVFGFLFYLFSK